MDQGGVVVFFQAGLAADQHGPAIDGSGGPANRLPQVLGIAAAADDAAAGAAQQMGGQAQQTGG